MGAVLPWDELDLQRVLTGAVPRYIEFLAEKTNGISRFECITRANSKQNPLDPNGVGVDVLSVLAADSLLAMELKKCRFDENGENPKLGEFADGQLNLLKRLNEHPSVSAYVVFNTLPEIECKHLPHSLQRCLAQLSSMAVLPPNMFELKPETLSPHFTGSDAIGATVLDVITKKILQRRTETALPFAKWVQVFEDSIGSLNNCVLWFISDGYVTGLTFEELKTALPYLTNIQSLPEGRLLIKAYRQLQAVRRERGNDVAKKLAAEQGFAEAQKTYLSAARIKATSKIELPNDGTDNERPASLGWNRP